MSNPGNAEAQAANTATEPSFAEKVNEVAKQLTQDDKGAWVLPTDLEVDDSVKFAATLEKRRRDTESALSKTRHQLKTEEETRKALEARGAAQTQLAVTPEEAEELEALKFENPDAWRQKINELEQKATATYQEELKTITSEASQKAELDRRAHVLTQFNNEHPDAQITDEVLANDIPPRIARKLERGEITFDDFLTEAHDFLVTPKRVVGEKAPASPNLGTAGGGTEPSAEALAQQELSDYSNTTF